MKIDKEFKERMSNVTEKDFYNFYFLKVILDICPCSFCITFRK